ncbi:MAG: restriction endonuclease fold toxin, partial [Myxococcota bacterium]
STAIGSAKAGAIVSGQGVSAHSFSPISPSPHGLSPQSRLPRELDSFETATRPRFVQVAARPEFANVRAERAGVSLRGHRGRSSGPRKSAQGSIQVAARDATEESAQDTAQYLIPNPPSKSVAQRRREARFREAAEALRSGDRDRAVKLLNQNAKEKGMTVVGLFGLDAMLTTLATLFPTAALATMMGAGFRSCDDIDALGVMLAAVARVGAGRRAKRLRGALPTLSKKKVPVDKRYRGRLLDVPKPDAHADALAKKLGGRSRVRFANDPGSQEFDVVSDLYFGEAKSAMRHVSKKFRKQARRIFEAAKATDRKVYYHFDGKPGRDVIDKLNEYSKEYGVEVVIDFAPL